MGRIIFTLVLGSCMLACGTGPVRAPRDGFIRAPDGVQLFYKVVGSGDDHLIVVHGGPGNSMNSILPDLEPLARDRTVIYYDQRGGGRSELVKDPAGLSIERHVEDLESVRKFFHLERVTLLGNSWGGMLAAFYAAAHPERVERIVLHSPGEPTRELMAEADHKMLARLDRELSAEQKRRYAFLAVPENWVAAADPKAVCREYHQLLLPFYVARSESIGRIKGRMCSGPDETVRYRQYVNREIMNSLGDWDLTSSLGAVRAPVLIVYGEADPAAPATPEAWVRSLPNAKRLTIADAGHLPHVEQSDVFFSAVERFLKAGTPADKSKSTSNL